MVVSRCSPLFLANFLAFKQRAVNKRLAFNRTLSADEELYILVQRRVIVAVITLEIHHSDSRGLHGNRCFNGGMTPVVFQLKITIGKVKERAHRWIDDHARERIRFPAQL